MNIEKLFKLLPKLTSKERDTISSKSLNELFFLHHFSGKEIFIPKKGCLYIIKSGKVISTVFIEDYLEFNMEFKEGECLGHIDLFLDESVDFILKGMPSATLLEVPITTLMDNKDTHFLLTLYDLMIRTLMGSTLKILKTHAAKVNFSNEQYLIDFLISNGGSFAYISTNVLAQLLHMDIHTLQRAMRKLTENKILKKNEKTLKIININSARKLLEIS